MLFFVWPETDIGQTVHLPCPCEDVLQSGNYVTRTCGGSTASGGEWMDVDDTQCVTSISAITDVLCNIAKVYT